MRGNVLFRALGVDGEQHYCSTLQAYGIDDTDAATLAHARTSPPDLAATARTWNQVAGLGVGGDVDSERFVLLH